MLGGLAIGLRHRRWRLLAPAAALVPRRDLDMPILYVAGMWFSVLLGLAFIGVYAWRVADEARLLANALAATELVLAREQHLSQLDGLAAAAAHELGTPLATIALVAKELETERAARTASSSTMSGSCAARSSAAARFWASSPHSARTAPRSTGSASPT